MRHLSSVWYLCAVPIAGWGGWAKRDLCPSMILLFSFLFEFMLLSVTWSWADLPRCRASHSLAHWVKRAKPSSRLPCFCLFSLLITMLYLLDIFLVIYPSHYQNAFPTCQLTQSLERREAPLEETCYSWALMWSHLPVIWLFHYWSRIISWPNLWSLMVVACFKRLPITCLSCSLPMIKVLFFPLSQMPICSCIPHWVLVSGFRCVTSS